MENKSIDDTINQNELVLENKEIPIFCRKCGNKLISGINTCELCGTEIIRPESNIIEEETTFNNEEYEASRLLSKKNKRKILLKILILIFSVAILVVVGFFASKLIVKPQDINIINGCPEFYDLEFTTTVEEASKKIKLKHTKHTGVGENSFFEVDDFMKNSNITIDENETYYLYGKKTENVYIGFDGKYLDSVLFSFSIDRYSLDDIAKLYKKIYGNETQKNSISYSWIGPKTTIDVFHYVFDDGEEEIVVRYVINTNSQYKNLTFDGPLYDPCKLNAENNVFGKKPDYFIEGLIENEDYDVEHSSVEGYTNLSWYTLYPEFEYMGLCKGAAALIMYVDEDIGVIDSAGYSFLLDKENVVTHIEHINDILSGNFGKKESCYYTSTEYSKLGIVDINYDKLLTDISKDIPRIYTITWNDVTLSIDTSYSEDYHEGTILFSK